MEQVACFLSLFFLVRRKRLIISLKQLLKSKSIGCKKQRGVKLGVFFPFAASEMGTVDRTGDATSEVETGDEGEMVGGGELAQQLMKR